MTSTIVSTRTSLASADAAQTRPRFGLLSLLVFVTATAALAAVYRLIESSQWLPDRPSEGEMIAAAWFAVLCFLGLFCGLLRSGTNAARFVFAAAGSVALLLAQLFSQTACWHVWGDVGSLFHWPIIWLALVPPALCIPGRFRSSIAAALVLAALTAPIWATHIVLVARLNMLRDEVLLIAEYAEAVKQDTGAYPNDLSMYPFHYPALRPRIEYVAPTDWWAPDAPSGDYLIAIKVHDEDNTTREYTPHKGWYYYPD